MYGLKHIDVIRTFKSLVCMCMPVYVCVCMRVYVHEYKCQGRAGRASQPLELEIKVTMSCPRLVQGSLREQNGLLIAGPSL